MIALNAATGKTVWKTAYPAPYKPAPAAAAHGAGPKATPLFHDGKLYALGISGILSAFDANTGKLVWQKPAASEHPYFGTAVSPLGDKDLVIAHPGNYGPLTAFSANTGDVKWTTKATATFASPIIMNLAGTRQVVTMSEGSVVGVSLEDGTLLWQHPWVSQGTPSAITPIVCGETIIVSGQKMGVTALKPTRRDGKWVVDVAWKTSEVSLFMSNPVLVGETLFGLSERASGQFFALDAATGKLLWLVEPRQATNTAIVKSGDLLFLLNDDAELIVARSSRIGFEPLKRYTVADSATWAHPAISGNRVFVKDVASVALWTLS
jgi:outer membrane protein assembly factor BamB